MDINISESPNKWVIVKIGEYYKVFGTWAGGYLDGDRWKMNSGIESVKSDDDFYYFIGYSGSCYKCHKKAYGFATSFGCGVLDNYVKLAKGQLEVLEDRDTWSDLIENN